MLKENDKAPLFTLPSTSGEEILLADFFGKKIIVLYFYPRDSSGGCTREAVDFRDNKVGFGKAGAAILGVSKDSMASHIRFSEKNDLNFDLLSDPDLAVCNAYGVYREKTTFGKTSMGIIRSTFVIDKSGIIRRIWDKVKVAGHAEEVLDFVKTLA